MPIRQRVPVKKLTDAAILIRRINREVIEKFKLPPGSGPADPLEFLLRIQAGLWPKDITDHWIAGGEDDLKGKPVPLDVRMEAAKIAARMARPFLSAAEVTGPEGGPIELATAVVNVQDMMKIPAMKKQIEALSLELSGIRRQKMLEGHATLEAIDTTAVTVPDEEEENPNGTTSDKRSGPDNPGEDGR